MEILEYVEPIRDRNKIVEVQKVLIDSSIKYGIRNYLIFQTGINTGLRISDIINLKVIEVKDHKHIRIREKKTNKINNILINSPLKKDFEKYIDMNNLQYEDFLFQSRKGINIPIKRQSAYLILKKASIKCGLNNIGTHSMRKTYGYHFIKEHPTKLPELMDLFNHSSQAMTLLYIGISQDKKDTIRKKFFFSSQI